MSSEANFTPSSKEVAVLLMARTRDAGGNLIGDFTDATSVTAEQASAAIQDAIDELAEAIGYTVSPGRIKSAKRLAKFLAAANIEMSYYPEQATADNSMYDKMMARYNALLPNFESDEGEEEIEGTEDHGQIGSFPPGQGWDWRPW